MKFDNEFIGGHQITCYRVVSKLLFNDWRYGKISPAKVSYFTRWFIRTTHVFSIFSTALFFGSIMLQIMHEWWYS